MQGRIHSTDSFGSVDGPGVRFLIFTQGCAMRCRYCHNADTWSKDGGTLMTADELLDKAERYRAYWGTEGGITVSGGEPLLQIDFLLELFEKAKARGINTCIDTAGQPFREAEPFFSKFQRLCELTDLFLADIKHIDPQEHLNLTGVKNDNILAMLRYLSEIGKPLRRTRAFIETLRNVQRIEVLPYHSMGAYKWDKLGLDYTLKDIQPPTAERIQNASEILNGLK